MKTTQERFDAALAAVAEQGVHLRMNVMECCRSCIGHEKLELPSREALDATPYAYHYGGQGNELVWHDDRPRYVNELDDEDDEDEEGWGLSRRQDYTRSADRLYFNHGGPGLVAATAVTEAFKAEGFEVEWGGTTFDSVQVVLV